MNREANYLKPRHLFFSSVYVSDSVGEVLHILIPLFYHFVLLNGSIWLFNGGILLHGDILCNILLMFELQKGSL